MLENDSMIPASPCGRRLLILFMRTLSMLRIQARGQLPGYRRGACVIPTRRRMVFAYKLGLREQITVCMEPRGVCSGG